MKKKRYKQLFTRMIYTWLLLLLIVLSILLQLFWLESLYYQERALNQAQLKLVDFTYRTELVTTRLTYNVKFFSNTFNPQALASYWDELQKVKKVDQYILFLKNLHSSSRELQLILQAKSLADSVRERELKAIKLILMAYNANESTIPNEIRAFQLTAEENALSKTEKIELSKSLLNDHEYLAKKATILKLIKQTRNAIVLRTQKEIQNNQSQIDYLINSLMTTTLISLIILAIIFWIRRLSLKRWLY